jgi:hypothetical protein
MIGNVVDLQTLRALYSIDFDVTGQHRYRVCTSLRSSTCSPRTPSSLSQLVPSPRLVPRLSSHPSSHRACHGVDLHGLDPSEVRRHPGHVASAPWSLGSRRRCDGPIRR